MGLSQLELRTCIAILVHEIGYRLFERSFARFENKSRQVAEMLFAADEEENAGRYSGQLDTPDRRISFAERLREALCQAQSSSSTDSSYAVDISVTGSSIEDSNIR